MRRITLEEFEERIKNRFPDESFTVLQYESGGKPAVIKCNTCGEKIKISVANNFLIYSKAYGCKNCHGLWKEREKKMNALLERYDIIDQEVRDTHKYYTIKCKKCGHIRRGVLNNFARFLECGCTTGIFRRDKEEFKDELAEMGYELLSEFTGMANKVLVRHKACGFIREVRASDLLYGNSRCPRCERKESRGVQFISNLLTKAGVPFCQEKAVGNGQRFDFFLDWCNTAIEYNGEQHYHYIEFFHNGLTTFEMQQERDKKKAKYCAEHGINLLVIPYTDSSDEIREKVQVIIDKFNDQSRDVESSGSK